MMAEKDSTVSVTVEEAAKLLNLSPYTIRKKIREGEIEAPAPINDRTGYMIPVKSLEKYESERKWRKDAALVSLIPGFAGIAAGTAMTGIGALVGAMSMTPLGLLAKGVSALVNDGIKDGNNDGRKDGNITGKANKEEILNLSIGGLEDEIDIHDLAIQEIELKGDDLSTDDERKILMHKIEKKKLQQQIKAIKLQYELEKQ